MPFSVLLSSEERMLVLRVVSYFAGCSVRVSCSSYHYITVRKASTCTDCPDGKCRSCLVQLAKSRYCSSSGTLEMGSRGSTSRMHSACLRSRFLDDHIHDEVKQCKTPKPMNGIIEQGTVLDSPRRLL